MRHELLQEVGVHFSFLLGNRQTRQGGGRLTLEEAMVTPRARRRAAAFFSVEKSEWVGVMQHNSKGQCSGPTPSPLLV